ncbi:MAG TPA: sigma-70 family RNA polymerase sigma factor [Thermomicrobiales bacterium]|jgi:RNA polymerase sigma-70 factor (ECF subfamily)
MQQRRRTDARALTWDDDALLAAIQARDDDALAAFYDRYGRLAFGLAYRMLGERGAAEDVVQESFLNVWRRAAGFDLGRGSARSWLMSIVHNLAVDRRRGRQRRTWTDVALDEVDALLETEDDDAFAVVAQSIDAERVQTALQHLPDEQRQAIVLAYFMGLTHQEIAEQTGTPLGTIKSRMRLGLRRMRALLGSDE